MSASEKEIDWDAQIDSFIDTETQAQATDRQLLQAISDSQIRTERMVSEFIEAVKPTVEKFSRSGMLGMLGFGG